MIHQNTYIRLKHMEKMKKKNSSVKFRFDLANKRPAKSSEGLITWKTIETKMPWSLMFLLGGGFAISKGSNASNLSKRIGESLAPLKDLPPFLILCVTCIITGTVTEFTSNIGIANIILPVIAQMVTILFFFLQRCGIPRNSVYKVKLSILKKTKIAIPQHPMS